MHDFPRQRVFIAVKTYFHGIYMYNYQCIITRACTCRRYIALLLETFLIVTPNIHKY